MADFPKLDSTKIEMHLQATGFSSVGVDSKPSLDERLFGSDYVNVSSDGNEVRIDPHYWANTGDSMYVSPNGAVRTSTAFGLSGSPIQSGQGTMRGDVLGILKAAQEKSSGTTAANLAAIIARIEKR